MKEAALSDVKVTHQKLSNNGQRFLLGQLFSLLERVLKIAFVAEFGDDVAIIGGVVDIVALEDVGMVQFFQGLDLAIQHLLLRLALDGTGIYHLDRHLFLGLVVGAAVDHGAEASPDDVLESV